MLQAACNFERPANSTMLHTECNSFGLLTGVTPPPMQLFLAPTARNWVALQVFLGQGLHCPRAHSSLYPKGMRPNRPATREEAANRVNWAELRLA